MKRMIVVFLIACMLCALCACGGNKQEAPAPAETPAPTEAPAAATPAPTQAPAETAAPVEDGQNPVMNFVGEYSAGRPWLLVEADGEKGAKITVRWGSSAFETSVWVMHGEFDEAALTVRYADGVRTDYAFREEGKEETETVRYENGTGRFVFHDGDALSVTWEDDKEQAGKDLTFEWCAVPDLADDHTEPEDFVGLWAYDRATLEIAPDGEGFKCFIQWSSSASELTQWEYDCFFDGEYLYSFENGTCTKLIYAGDGSVSASETVFTDGAASFHMIEGVTLRWIDYKEYPDGGVYEFERVEPARLRPTAAQFADEFFREIISFHPGTSGGSLAEAKAAANVYTFAAAHRLWCADPEALQAALREALADLSDDERAGFDENYISVIRLIDACLCDWEGCRGQFESAGAAEKMEAWLAVPTAPIAWATLCENVGTVLGDGA